MTTDRRFSNTLFLILALSGFNLQAQNISWDDFGIGKQWSTAFNWNPNGIPGSANDVFIGDLANAASDQTIIDQDFTISDLTLTNFTSVDTTEFKLIAGDIDLGLGTDFIVSKNTSGDRSLQFTGLIVNNLATFQMNGGEAAIGGSATTNLGGAFGGFGTFRFTNGLGAPTTIFTNNGSFGTGREAGASATSHFVLNMVANDADARIDLDGTTNNRPVGIVENTTLNLDMQALDFNGVLSMAAGSVFDTANDFQAAAGSQLITNAGSGSTGVANTATIRGANYNALNGSLTSVNSGVLALESDFTSQSTATVSVAANAGLRVDGTTTINGNLNLNQNAHITVNGDMTINDPSFNLDGSNSNTGVTTVNNDAVLTINSDQINLANNDFTGTLNVNSGTLNMNTPTSWTLLGNLNLNDNDGAIGESIVDGALLRVVGGTITAAGNLNNISSNVEFFGGSSATDVSAGARLNFREEVTFHGGSSHTGNGTLGVGAAKLVTVDGPTTFNMPNGTVSLDSNSSSLRDYQLNDDLTINAASVGNFGSFTPGATRDKIHINNSTAKLTVNLTNATDRWTLGEEGELNVSSAGIATTSLDGSPINVLGTINVDGVTQFDARVDLGTTGTVNINGNGSVLFVDGGSQSDPNRWEGGLVQGSGELHSFSSGVRGFGQIDTDIYFNGGSDLIADDGLLTINGEVLEVDYLGAATGGTLTLTRTFDTSIARAMNFTGGTVNGEVVKNNGTTSGYGTVASDGFVNNGLLNSTGGGELTISTVAAPDLDGDGENGTIQAISGELLVTTALAEAFDGSAIVGAGRHLEFQHAWTLGSSGQLDLLGTSSQAASLQGAGATLNGTVNVDRIGRLAANATIRPTSKITLDDGNDVLELAGNTTVQPGALFTGDGFVRNLNGATLTLNVGSDVDVPIANAGNLRISAGLGVVDVETVELDSSSSLRIRLGGTTVGTFDQFIVSQNATLNGELDVDLVSGFVPSLDDEFVFLQTTNGFVNSTFDSLDLPSIHSSLAWQVDYSDPLTVWLRVINATISGDFDGNGDFACNDIDLLVSEIAAGTNGAAFDLTGDGNVNGADLDAWLAEAGAAELASGNAYLLGDANLDGNVNGQDFIAWNNSKFTSGAGWCGGDFNADGETDGQDFVIWNSNKFTSADNELAAVPEPTSLVLLLLGGLAGLNSLRSRAA